MILNQTALKIHPKPPKVIDGRSLWYPPYLSLRPSVQKERLRSFLSFLNQSVLDTPVLLPPLSSFSGLCSRGRDGGGRKSLLQGHPHLRSQASLQSVSLSFSLSLVDPFFDLWGLFSTFNSSISSQFQRPGGGALHCGAEIRRGGVQGPSSDQRHHHQRYDLSFISF